MQDLTKLEIGPGLLHHEGYISVDIEEKYLPDILGDFRDMNFVDIDEIRAYHLLEHFSEKEAIDVLKQWRSWLKVGGVLNMEVPDFEGICKYFLNDVRCWGKKEQMIMHAYGSQEADWAFHKSGWYEDKLRATLHQVGFTVDEIEKRHSYYRDEERTRYRLPNLGVMAKKV